MGGTRKQRQYLVLCCILTVFSTFIVFAQSAVAGPFGPAEVSGVVTLHGTSSDAGSGVRNVVVTFAGEDSGVVCANPPTPTNWQCKWDTTNMPRGHYDVTETVWDNANNSSTRHKAFIVVDPPAVDGGEGTAPNNSEGNTPALPNEPLREPVNPPSVADPTPTVQPPSPADPPAPPDTPAALTCPDGSEVVGTPSEVAVACFGDLLTTFGATKVTSTDTAEVTIEFADPATAATVQSLLREEVGETKFVFNVVAPPATDEPVDELPVGEDTTGPTVPEPTTLLDAQIALFAHVDGVTAAADGVTLVLQTENQQLAATLTALLRDPDGTQDDAIRVELVQRE